MPPKSTKRENQSCQRRVLKAALAALWWSSALVASADSAPQTAVITFSGLWNGTQPSTSYVILHRPLPSTYQPLMEAEPITNPVDGGNLGIQIEWSNALCS